jgi:SAM-dependent methyltransferase
MDNAAPELFDRSRRRIVRNRAWRAQAYRDFYNSQIADEIRERLMFVQRDFADALLIGSVSDDFADWLTQRGTQCFFADSAVAPISNRSGVWCDEDRLPFADHSFDLIVSVGVFDSINDVPGALILSRRILRPDGLLLAGFPGGDGMGRLRSSMIAAEGDRVAPHFHPRIDVRSAGDLLQRAGFAMPVADSVQLKVRYRSLTQYLADLRDAGYSSALAGSHASIGKHVYQAMQNQWTNGQEEIQECIFLSGWAPHPDQPKAARRGSATVSLAKALPSKA